MDSYAIRLSKVWIFGDLWCSIWLAVDVWMCTASILNLCAISLDRYLAVTRPVSYPQASTIYRLFDFVEQVYDETLDEAICPLLGYSPPLIHSASVLLSNGQWIDVPGFGTALIDRSNCSTWNEHLNSRFGLLIFLNLNSQKFANNSFVIFIKLNSWKD